VTRAVAGFRAEETVPIAEVVDLTKHYLMGETVVAALRGVSVSFEEGDFFAIMGPSGSGKSTLMNLLGCLDRPTSGHYFLGGEDVALLDDDALSEIRSRKIGFIFQSFNLIPQLTVLENVEVPLFYQGWDPGPTRKRAMELASMVGLEDRLHHRPAQLSGGQQQRVAIARALVNDPLILLADEPTGNLDSSTEAEILALLDDLNRQGKTVIVVTHADHVAARARKVLQLRDGLVESIIEKDGARLPEATP
jgi:putative ABC transport system ATP-binding protein